jgi:hypothetical protein
MFKSEHSRRRAGVRTLRNRSQSPLESANFCGDRATAPVENIRCEKIRGCSYRKRRVTLDVRYAPIATNFCSAAK